MRKIIIIASISLAIFILGLANKSYTLDINKEKSRNLVIQGDESLMAKNFNSAKIFYKMAIQFDPFNKEAIEKYENLIKVTAPNSKVDLSVFENLSSKKTTPSDEKNNTTKSPQKGQAPKKPALEFQGC